MTELQFIQSEQAKCDDRLTRLLHKVNLTGWSGRKAIDMLYVNGLVTFGGPRLEINYPYNCYRLTEKGRSQLQSLTATICD